ncbi:MAG: hypothetical protein HY047_07440 [Acidobacteria bacterium]|nr:hypothetical protein [Acidobacteriota bacterium]
MVDEPRESADFFLRFCDCLNRFDVRYVVVGSEAVAFHGAPRYSADFDTFVLATRANLFRVVAALEAFGLTELAKTVDPEVWAKTGATLRVGEAPTQVDVLLQLSGVDFHRVAAGAVEGRYGAVPVLFIGFEDLIANKRAAGRPKDLADVDSLERHRR